MVGKQKLQVLHVGWLDTSATEQYIGLIIHRDLEII